MAKFKMEHCQQLKNNIVSSRFIDTYAIDVSFLKSIFNIAFGPSWKSILNSYVLPVLLYKDVCRLINNV